jgi:hypothetical protein
LLLELAFNFFLKGTVGDSPTSIFFAFILNERKDYTTKKKSKKKEYKANRPKKKKTKSYEVILLPQRERSSSTLLGLDTHKTQLFFESSFLGIKTDLAIVKYNSIPSDPDDPTSCDAYLPEDATSKIASGFDDHVKMRKVQVPVDWDCTPTINTEGAFEKEMETSFFNSTITKHTVIIIKLHMLSP